MKGKERFGVVAGGSDRLTMTVQPLRLTVKRIRWRLRLTTSAGSCAGDRKRPFGRNAGSVKSEQLRACAPNGNSSEVVGSRLGPQQRQNAVIKGKGALHEPYPQSLGSIGQGIR